MLGNVHIMAVTVSLQNDVVAQKEADSTLTLSQRVVPWF